jgi:hypothetical protein
MRKKTEEAIGLLADGIEIARSQGALTWELKLASTLVGIDVGSMIGRVPRISYAGS